MSAAVQKRQASVLPPSLPPRGVTREQAAAYIGLSPTKFDELVKDGRMPKAKPIDGARRWDLRKVDQAFDLLGEQDTDKNPWDDLPCR